MNDNDFLDIAKGKNVAVMYVPPDCDPALPYQVDGYLFDQSAPAIEGEFLIMMEPCLGEEVEEHEVVFRAIPITWVVGVTIISEIGESE